MSEDDQKSLTDSERRVSWLPLNHKTIFVFGSNLRGIHGKGAAAEATRHWGARRGQGEGRTGNAYAIPTKWDSYDSCTEAQIRRYVEDFRTYAAHRIKDHLFLLTAVGTGYSGKPVSMMAPMFANMPGNVLLPKKFLEYLGRDATDAWDKDFKEGK